jgi:hypothetical protein
MPRNAHRSGSVSRASKANQWQAYDRLPPSVRAALQNSTFDWAPYPIHRAFENGQRTAKETVRAIAKWDAAQIKRDRKRVSRGF